MTWTPTVWKARGKWLSLALVGSVALSSGTVHAAPHAVVAVPTAQTWLTLERPWLCRTWITPDQVVRHCTTHWHLDSQRRVVSDDPAWVPLADTLAGVDDGDLTARLPLAYGPPIKRIVVRGPTHPTHPTHPAVVYSASQSSGPYGLWTPPPGYHAYAMSDYAGDPNAAEFGYCTWWAQYKRQDERLINLGNAWQWAGNAAARGLSVGSTPRVGETVVFAPGVEGASGEGHVAHVEAVYTGGWFLISEMNMAWNGGGWGRVSYRYALAAPGVSFIY